MEWFKELAPYVGPLGLVCFAGTFLGGLLLSFFWKTFGPWKELEACRRECEKCHAERQVDAADRAKLSAQVADLGARYDILLDAVHASGLGLRLTADGMERVLPNRIG